ncbi:hypothetical protein TIFTF001_040072 [Ficus carica]|uniref:Uncharacterized protein n=1 Tax=Ficus carica TaxID=3494 RepID=A0AA88CLV3_FICCA|nr:hypothetical protein TIFTF001_040072 [Ficus carica]
MYVCERDTWCHPNSLERVLEASVVATSPWQVAAACPLVEASLPWEAPQLDFGVRGTSSSRGGFSAGSSSGDGFSSGSSSGGGGALVHALVAALLLVVALASAFL